MELVVGLVVLLVAMSTLAIVAWDRRGVARPPDKDDAPTTPSASVVPRADAWGFCQFLSDLSPDIGSGTSLVYAYGRPGEVLVFGDPVAARHLGPVVGQVPRDLARLAVGTDAATRLVTAAGERTGMLVRLTEESTRKYKELRQLNEASGATLGIFQNGDGKFAHVARFTSTRGVDIATNITGALQGIALQAQLASLERAIGEVSSQVSAVHRALDARRQADERATRTVVLEVYAAARQTGTLTSAMWDQIAPLAQTTHRHHELACVEMEQAIDDLHVLAYGRIKDRRSELQYLADGGAERLFGRLRESRQTLAQFQALRLWYLLENGDRSALTFQEFLREDLEAKSELLSGFRSLLELGTERAGERSRLETVFSPFDAHRLQQHADRLLELLSEVTPPGEAAQPPQLIPRQQG